MYGNTRRDLNGREDTGWKGLVPPCLAERETDRRKRRRPRKKEKIKGEGVWGKRRKEVIARLSLGGPWRKEEKG